MTGNVKPSNVSKTPAILALRRGDILLALVCQHITGFPKHRVGLEVGSE
jgi:hypothetical protein